MTHQANLEHPSPLHVSAHYLNQTAAGPAEVHIRVVKRGKTFVNIAAELKQQVETLSKEVTRLRGEYHACSRADPGSMRLR